MATRTLVVATGNPGKLREIRQVLADVPVEVKGLGDLPDAPPEPEETGTTFAENARLKALYYARHTHLWCLADDSGLAVDALDGAPGVRSARYAGEVPSGADRTHVDAANNAKLLADLSGTPEANRTARFVCHLALADADRVLLEATGTVEGRILHAPRGHNGFGYDPVFFLEDLGRTAAELSAEEKNAVSHRGQAVRGFARKLQAMLAAS